MKIHKLNLQNKIIETIELNEQFMRPGDTYLIECKDEKYILTEKNITNIEPLNFENEYKFNTKQTEFFW